jgi:serine carboxypeptidase-like clade 4
MSVLVFHPCELIQEKEDPLVLWMTGGPGCASELALFYENGPFKITNNLTLEWNNYGWDKVHSVFFLLSV